MLILCCKYFDSEDCIMKKFIYLFIVAIGSMSMQFGYADEHEEAEEESDWYYEGFVTITSDYMWRGVSQSQNKPAVQHGITVGHSSGTYFGYFISNVDFEPNFPSRTADDPDTTADETVDATFLDNFQPGFELDIFAGNYYEISDDFAIDFGGLIYTYNFTGDVGDANGQLLGSNSRNYGEIYLNFVFLGGQLTFSTNYTADYLGYAGKANYYALLFDVDVSENIGIRGGFGQTVLSQKAANFNSVGVFDANDNASVTSILDYKLAIAVKWNDGTDEVEFAFIGLDDNGKSFFGADNGAVYGGDTYEDKFVISLTKGF